MNKVTLFLMSNKGYLVLKHLCEKAYAGSIDLVVSSNDEAVQRDYLDEIRQLCADNGISFCMRNDEYRIKTEHCIAISWRWMLHTSNSQLIVLHDSLLPRYRGFSPLVNQLVNNEKLIGVTALFAENETYDSGPIIAQRSVEVVYPIKISDAIELVSGCYCSLVQDIFDDISASNKISSENQVESDATYSLWRNSEDYVIDWSGDARKIRRMIDAVGYPYKGAVTRMDGHSVRIWGAIEVEDVIIENRDVGKVIFLQEEFPVVVCGSGLLKITEARFEENNESILPLRRFRTKFQ